MSLPYFPMFPADFEADTSHLTLEEDGAYNRLLRLLWMSPGCTLPSDPSWLSRRLRLDVETYDRVVAPLLEEFFRVDKGRVFSPRLMIEWEKANDTHAKRSEAGRKGGRPAKPLKSKEADKSRAKAGTKQPEPEPEPYNTPLPPKGGEPDPFDAFYAAYPRKEGKAPARKAYRTALKSTDAETILRHATAYAKARAAEIAAGKSEARFTKHPATWLNAKPWEDAPSPSKPVPTFNFRGGAEYDDETLRARDAMREHLARRRPLPEAMGEPS